MSDSNLFTGLITGICLSSATGFRIFIPFLIISLFSNLTGIPAYLSIHGMSSLPVLYALFALSIAEIIGYYNPWIDNMLDLITTPLSLAAGIFMTILFLNDMNPVLKWIIAIIIGGGISVNIHLMTVKGRALASAFKSGSGNAIFSTIELLSAILISILAITIPWISLIVILLIVYFILKYVIKKGKRNEVQLRIKK